jgi:hypothetical protein
MVVHPPDRIYEWDAIPAWPVTVDSLNKVLCAGKQRQRTFRQPGTPLFNTSAHCFRQQAVLGLKS